MVARRPFQFPGKAVAALPSSVLTRPLLAFQLRQIYPICAAISPACARGACEHVSARQQNWKEESEILYQLIQGSNGSGSSRTHSTPSCSYGHDRTSNEQKSSGDVNYELQLAVDEALARELQEMEGKLANTSLNDDNGRKPTSSSAFDRGNNSASRPPQVVEEDGIDPDNMTYEELQQLGEAIGTESKGLPESVIALLPTSTYKIGIFSRKEKHDECVICCMAYKNRDRLTKLPCGHQYHQACVAKWLQINKDECRFGGLVS
ncbi:unnamed protein product [Miscanthus lutarioriparius]|uniref:RING-type domain-containing protein n=1 Tax=Miscanthus lutarioriparius TaxID=422564 RepID=A0A811QX16_9POAL|nr:unnamed protein product [Miscanthus lutarioriparius]